jgi:hypothetical protein
VAFQKPFVAWSAGRIQNFLELTFSVVVEPPERIVNVQNVRVLKQHGIRRLGNTVVSVSQIVSCTRAIFNFRGRVVGTKFAICQAGLSMETHAPLSSISKAESHFPAVDIFLSVC